MTVQEPPVRLKYGLAATIVVDEHDRPKYVPPPVAYGEHAATCGCRDCVLLRVKGK